MHCVKSVQIRSFFWSLLSPNTGKYGPEKTPYLDAFPAVMLSVKWFHYIRNEVIQQRTNPNNRLLHQVKKRKLSLFRHICRVNNNRLIKTVVTGITSGKKKRRPRAKWISNNKE